VKHEPSRSAGLGEQAVGILDVEVGRQQVHQPSGQQRPASFQSEPNGFDELVRVAIVAPAIDELVFCLLGALWKHHMVFLTPPPWLC